MYSSAKKLQRILSSRDIRKTFIDYFTVNHEHKFVRSSPVIPFCDPTVAFVNAGMNQFKSVFLGKAPAPYPRVTNSQKCVRVGGKHNDLSVVGQDGYHHTFFEMLGNWSFDDYFKKEACEMALDLLRGPYNIDPRRLYVTFFAGDKILGLPADLECHDIWRSLGFPNERILPFGVTDNFWEMGTTGPCGPCTEIHIDHRPDLASVGERAKLVNAGRSDLTELWNIVFIQYNRLADGNITALPARHVDTGMGFERLTAILQNKSSNYDTDLFTPIFDAIQKISKAPDYKGEFATVSGNATCDTGYRILADHARMVTACLSDGMLPDQNQKLRRVLRKAVTVGESVFNNSGLLQHLVPVVVQTLGSAYPEMVSKQNDVIELIAHEQEVFKSLRETASKAFAEVFHNVSQLDDVDLMESPGFVPAYKELLAQKSQFRDGILPGTFLYKLADTYGLSEDTFQKLADLENFKCDLSGYRQAVDSARLKTKTSIYCNANDTNFEQMHKKLDALLTEITQKLPPTNNDPKYDYVYNAQAKNYHIPQVTSKVRAITWNDQRVDAINSSSVRPHDIVCIVTEASNFYYEAGGQQSDSGELIILQQAKDFHEAVRLPVFNVKCLNDCVVHMCEVPHTSDNFHLSTGDAVQLEVDAEKRKLNTCHHTATHLLNGAIRCLFKKVTYQVSSAVTSDNCKLEVGLIGKRITKEDIERIEDLIGRAICCATPLDVLTLNAADVLAQQSDITMVPGEIYPETGLRLINIDCDNVGLHSKELCCGTHVRNTKEIEYFCITSLKQTNRARYAFTAVAGTVAENVLMTAALMRHRVDLLEEQFKTDKMTNATEAELQKIRHTIMHTNIVLPYAFKMDALERINDILRKLRESSRTTLKEFVEVEMKNLLQENPLVSSPYILHYISSSALMEEVPLQRATKLCTDRPILVIGMCDNIVKARCCVPQKYLTEHFNAEIWLREFAATFRTQVSAPKGQNPASVCNMKGKKVSTQFEEQLENAMAKANDFAVRHLNLENTIK